MVYKCVVKAGQEHKHCVGVGIGLVLSFATDSYFRHWKALKLLKFDSGLYRLCGKVSVLLPEREERKKTFSNGTVYWAPVCPEALQRDEKGGLDTLQAQHRALGQPGVLWPSTRNRPTLCASKTSITGFPALGCPGCGWISKGLRRGTGDTTDPWPEEEVLGLQSSAAEPGWPWTLSFESLFCLWYSGFQKATCGTCDESSHPPGFKCS